MIDYDEFDEDESFDEYSDEFPEDEEAETLPCPHCRAEIYEDAEQCPHCGEYVTHSTSVWAGRPWWWIVLGLLGIVAVIFVLLLLGNWGGG